MKLRFPSNFGHLVMFACAGAAAPVVTAGETSGLPAEFGSLLRTGSARLPEISIKYDEAERSGDFRKGMNALAIIANESKATGDRPAWLEAELAWLKLAAREGEDVDIDDALEELITRARDWELGRQEAAVYTFWAEHLENQDEWLMALRALDGAAQASLGEGLVNQALETMLKMSRLCRDNGHPWRLQQVWVRINQVEQELAASINEDSRKPLEDERALVLPLLEQLAPAVPAGASVDIQPTQAAVKVSSSHGEVGRARFFVTNETVHTVKGTLEIAAKTGAVKTWETGRSGHWLTLGPAGAAPADAKTGVSAPSKKSLSLRPGERVSVYVEREQPAAQDQDTVNLTWSAPGGEAIAKSEFAFAPKLPQSSVVNSGSFTVRPGWAVPLYQEINFRGQGLKVEDLQFQSSVPCRLEIFDVDGGRHPSVDAGSLLAVDAEGDGYFTGSEDRVVIDNNENGNPDVVIGDRSRSLEIYAWPLVPLKDDTEITVSTRLLRTGQAGNWRTDAENVLGAPKKANFAKPSATTTPVKGSK
ncbi:MAG TPA: hypothetical protein VHM91_24170 [Verrucomicrobiales bacterium]|jgi:hypothetical protein|nr:hypothetical protein [Verrucomicrobiales bacterium]